MVEALIHGGAGDVGWEAVYCTDTDPHRHSGWAHSQEVLLVLCTECTNADARSDASNALPCIPAVAVLNDSVCMKYAQGWWYRQ